MYFLHEEIIGNHMLSQPSWHGPYHVLSYDESDITAQMFNHPAIAHPSFTCHLARVAMYQYNPVTADCLAASATISKKIAGN